jgi:hypothetical protein
MTNPYRAMCAELLLFSEEAGEICMNESLWPKSDPTCTLQQRARALLAQPVAEGPLSPAAQAIIDASNCAGSRIVQLHIADALRALAVRINGADAIRQDVLDIADELENQ